MRKDLDLNVADCLARVRQQDQDAARSLVEYPVHGELLIQAAEHETVSLATTASGWGKGAGKRLSAG
jgi:hypothetical protein